MLYVSTTDVWPEFLYFLGGVDNLLHGSTFWLRSIQWISWTLNTIISSEIKCQDRWTELLMLLHSYSMTLYCTTYNWGPNNQDSGRPPRLDSNAVLNSEGSHPSLIFSFVTSLSCLTEVQAKMVCWCIVIQSRMFFFLSVVKSRPFANSISRF